MSPVFLSNSSYVCAANRRVTVTVTFVSRQKQQAMIIQHSAGSFYYASQYTAKIYDFMTILYTMVTPRKTKILHILNQSLKGLMQDDHFFSLHIHTVLCSPSVLFSFYCFQYNSCLCYINLPLPCIIKLTRLQRNTAEPFMKRLYEIQEPPETP